ncbi:Phospholipid-transporting ATPase DNF1; AltName: Full=Flippase DNF1 [Serendipita indica DSM 11827]|uniref:Phospholipid-transporting ATPase n=1 Tax=Serendipita indica (strain DSM 11827) TaxID=1109443 RepID=G4TC25_SERID|nr:Phospholipid-transporting ATPase DNF1; AltName: Full=Flippase DNF1 [Serendipita indica DSM 11827]CCA68868.1 related to DNF1-protein transporter [Serendipita indica DSM 11827]
MATSKTSSSPPKRSWLQRFRDFDIAKLFSPAPPPQVPRTVYVNHPLPDDFYVHKRGKRKVRKDARYATNQVVTSKYTVLTFLPRNLLEQFRRIANIFFAFICILQFFPRFSTISPGLVVLPLIIVLLITAVKDGYEDVKRHQSDRKVNHTRVLVLEGENYHNHNAMGSKSKTFTRGMRIPYKRKKAQDKDSNNTLVEKPSTIEDEDNLVDIDTPKPHWRSTAWEDVRVGDFVKIRADEPFPGDIIICATSDPEDVAFVETKNLDGETNLKSRRNVSTLSHLRSATACATAGGFRIDADKPESNMYRLNAKITAIDEKGQDVGKPEPIDLNTVLLRGTVLRNTDWAIGIVLFTGGDTKIVLNSGGTPSKRSKVERQMNPMVFINLALLAIVGVVCAIVDSALQRHYLRRSAYWVFGEPLPDDNPSFNGFTTFFNALITFQNVVPISLYISIEFVRTCQAAFIYFDSEMYYEPADQKALSRSWNLSDDLGQVKFVVSDKTGTLTQNSMVFRKCSIGGKIYEGDEDEDYTETQLRERPADATERVSSAVGEGDAIPLAVLSSTGHGSSTNVNSTITPPLNPKVPHFRDTQLFEDIQRSASGEPSAHARALNAFMTTLALCHTAIASVSDEDGSISYKAQSPDESALVQAAADAGFIFLGKDKDTLRLKTPFLEGDAVEEYELLHVLDFTSARKRMSVILRRTDTEGGENAKRVFLLCKGADSVIIERLKAGQNEFTKTTEEHLEYFASSGLRTLCLAYKVIPDAEYEEWSHRYHEATVALDDREDLIEQVSDEMERGLRLLGATAIEDKLQDGVPETIADLKRAGIKIWVATGDKLETAISIGYSTNLIAPDSNLIVVRGGEFGQAHAAYDQMVQAVERFFPTEGILDLEEVHPPEIHTTEKPPHSPKPGNIRRAATGLSEILDDDNGRKPGGYILVIDGVALGHAMEESFSKELLLQIGLRCEAVICCRVSPLQKAQLVHLIKDNLQVLTLAIGDGANDVSMIQAADVGVGISGEEGLQAVNSSDYAIAQFKYLKRLLLVHGHWSYARNSNMIGNFFYKNLVIVAVLFWFQIYCAWSTTYVIDYTYLLFWNVFWSLAPVIAIGIFDRNIDDDVLMAIPELYRYGREGAHFGLGMFSWYMLDAVAAIVFFLITYSYALTTSRSDGYGIAMYEYSATMVLATVMIVNLFNGLNTHAWTGWVFFAVSFGIVLVWGFTAIYSTIRPGWFVTSSYGNYYLLFHSVDFWFGLLLTIPLALLPRYIDHAVRFIFFPSDFDILRWIKKTEPKKDFAADPALGGKLKARHDGTQSQLPQEAEEDDQNLDTRSMASSLHPPRRSFQSSRPNLRQDWRSGSRTDMSTGQLVANRGFNFSAEEGGIAIRRTQTNLSERYIQRLGKRTNTTPSNHPYMSSAPALPRPADGNSGKRLSFLRRSMRKPKEDE